MPLHDWSTTLRQSLFFPHDFFAERKRREKVAFDVVALVALLHFVLILGVWVIVFVQIAPLHEGRFGPLLFWWGVSGIGVGLFFVVFTFVTWLIVSGVLHTVVKFLDNRTSVGATLYVVGWSSPVALLILLVAGADVISIFSGLSPSTDLEAQLSNIPTETPGLTLETGVVLLWQGYIWAAGLRETHDMPQKDAWIASAVSVVILVVLAFLG